MLGDGGVGTYVPFEYKGMPLDTNIERIDVHEPSSSRKRPRKVKR